MYLYITVLRTDTTVSRNNEMIIQRNYLFYLGCLVRKYKRHWDFSITQTIILPELVLSCLYTETRIGHFPILERNLYLFKL